ncbi:hypothetical protein GCM10009639_54630 [Kitasatospora putterlickiae]|uniref:Uncharacterized protein n=1 Tax=Kitasatospora putterlickiae TaxID=221725 RepID=A0ABP4J6R8_9ACTN
MEEAVAAFPREISGSAAAPARSDQPSTRPPINTSTAANTPTWTGLTETPGRILDSPILGNGESCAPVRTTHTPTGEGSVVESKVS